MAERWPLTLPQTFLEGSLIHGLPDNTITSETETGPSKRRRRTTANVRPFGGRQVLSDLQRQTLETFYQATTLSGSLVVTFPDPLGGDDLSVWFEGPPDFEQFPPGRWFVNLRFVVLP